MTSGLMEKVGKVARSYTAAEWRRGFEDVVAAIRLHGQELLAIPGVLFVRPGFRFRDGKLTTEPAVVVSVANKQEVSSIATRDLVPQKLGRAIVDVVPANPKEQLLFAQLVNAFGGAASRLSVALPGELDQTEANSFFFAPLEPYVPPSVPLAAVTEQMTVVCHASPDAGWRILRDFLLGTETRLTSTMYEFTARHVLDTLVEALGEGGRELSLILDAGHQQLGSGDVSKAEVVDTLTDELADRFRFAWAAVGDDNVTSAAFFKNAYHIKVSVRDGDSFWLSSGNWKRSGQPTIDPINGPFPPGFDPAAFQRRSNREWHVVIKSPNLARLFETYITHDITQAEEVQLPQPALVEPIAMPDVFIPTTDSALLAPPQFFRELEVSGNLTVQPLMTPDNFVDFVLPLIEGAERKLYFQNQSLKPNPANPKYMRLFNALRDKSRDPGVDVRILVRGDFDAATILSTLQANGFNMDRVKLQNGNHNKGILVDGKTVLGSHNWTGDGATLNRDASLIFDNADISSYYEELFLHDWNNLSFSGAPELREMARIAAPGEPTPAGMVRVPWDEVFSDD
ncbi:MAG TPA: phospholipase D-like domain-containing protein [Pyrinomonadaceae bacterium]|nr:phospholipase D-like domain-containing protein [Pyrinomonadaceae bacterium]